MLERSPYGPVDPKIATFARAGVAVVLVAAAATWLTLFQTPTYEASAQVRVDQEQSDQQTNLAGSGEERQTEGLPRIRIDIPEDSGRLQELAQTMSHATDSRPVAEETIRRLGLRMEPAEVLDNSRKFAAGRREDVLSSAECPWPYFCSTV